jgi:NADPH-dependent 2,4-dienoyl-CoA reductase/sulfur reductase-like enzyme
MADQGTWSSVSFDRETLPVLYACEVAVIGGSFGGVAAALALARAGRRVALVEPRTYLGREITATLRPWVRVPAGDDIASLPEVISACIRASGASARDGEVPLHMDAVKIRLEDMLLAAGVKLVYASLPVGLCVQEGRVQGVIVGNKSGRQVIRCAVAIDATETALLARLAGAGFEAPPEDTARFSCTLEFTGVDALPGAELPVPQHLGLVSDRVVLHTGYRGADHVLLEYALTLPSGVSDALAAAQRDAQARRQTTALAEYLLSGVPAFAPAYLATWSYELDGPHVTRMAGPAPDWARDLAAVVFDVGVMNQGARIAASELAGPVGGLWCLNQGARMNATCAARIRDPVAAAQLGTLLAQAIDGHWASASGGKAPPAALPALAAPDRGRLRVMEQEQPQRGRDYNSFPVTPAPIPVLRTADVVVVGGGTSGAVSGIIAGQEGMRTVVVDMNPGLGGTATYGGIHDYWFARRIGYVDKLMGWLAKMHDRLRMPRPEGVRAHWNIEARAWALAEEAEAAGVELLLNGYVIASIVEGRAVRGVVVATRWGPVALLSQVTIDATGDGDVAAFAGADCVYGSDREHAVMYAYMPQVAKPGLPRNVKTSMLDTTNVEDYTRTLLAERRRGLEDDHDHGVYIGPRESRHIAGDVILTFTDQLTLRGFPDVAYIAFSNHDMKGESTSDWIRMGLQAPNIEMEIPYSALTPKEIEDILVVGKAYSATHDALAAPRMMPDLENLGGVAAIAAAMAVRAGKVVRDIDVRALQERLVEEGALPERVLTRTLVPLAYSDGELAAMIDGLDPEKPLHSYSDAQIGEQYQGRVPLVDIMCAGPRVVPILEQALRRAQSAGEEARAVLLARMLAVLGSKAGVSALVSAIQDELSGDELPGRAADVRHVGYPPDQGAGPDAAHLLYCLGMARDPKVIPLWERTAELLAGATMEDIFDRKRAWYYYVSAIAYGAERMGDVAAVPVLKRLHGYPLFRSQVTTSGFQPEFREERLAYLEMLIGRAMARCGSPEGFLVLINYLDDVRTLLAEHAHAELVAIAGEDLGKNVAAWGQWLEREGEALQPVPWTGPADPLAAWQEAILIEA